MKNKKQKALEDFMQDQEADQAKKVINTQREGLIERVDKIIITQDGKQLLREQY